MRSYSKFGSGPPRGEQNILAKNAGKQTLTNNASKPKSAQKPTLRSLYCVSKLNCHNQNEMGAILDLPTNQHSQSGPF